MNTLDIDLQLKLTFLFFGYDACIIKFCGTADFFDLMGTVLELSY